MSTPGPISIYQIYHDEATRAKVDPLFLPLDNSSNLKPDWYEYWPIRQVFLTEKFADDHYVGFLSPRFNEKTNLSGEQVLSKVKEGNSDVFSFSPLFDQGALFQNPFEQGDFWHPGLSQVTGELLQYLQLDVDLPSLVCDCTTTIFSNYFVARVSFWKEWLHYAEKIFDLCENGESSLRTALTATTTHRGSSDSSMKVFVMERLVTLLLEHRRESAAPGFDLKRGFVGFPQAGRFLTTLIVCDALKGQFRRTRLSAYLDGFRAHRGTFFRAISDKELLMGKTGATNWTG